MKKLIILGLICVCLIVTSCATILDEGTSSVLVNSDPSGAMVKVDGYPMGSTPVALSLDSGSSHTIEVSKEGYETQYATVKKSVKWGWQVLDVFATGFVGNVVDLITPNGYELKPNKIYVNLTELK